MELFDSRTAQVGSMPVRRALPARGRRMVGAWCFADHLGPLAVSETGGLDIGPHPHIGLQTVTWLVDGQALHHDSLGSEQVIRPGQLNLMTAGRGIAHAEEGTGHYRGTMQGIQLWIAQPEATRNGEPAFEHYSSLPQRELPGVVITVLLGDLAGQRSLARHDTPLVGAELDLFHDAVVPVRPDFEHALIVLTGAVTVDGARFGPGQLAYFAPGRQELVIATGEPTRAMLIGGTPFEAPIVMWWNFVARSRAEIDTAFDAWRADRFDPVPSALPRIDTPPPFWRTWPHA